MWHCLETLKKISASPKEQLNKYLEEGKKVIKDMGFIPVSE